MKIAPLILVWLILNLTAYDKKTVDCLVISDHDPYVITCDLPDPSKDCQTPAEKLTERCQHLRLYIPRDDWKDSFSAWNYGPEIEGSDIVPEAASGPALGQRLKASYLNGVLVPLKPCSVRAKEAIDAYCSVRHYCRPPNSLLQPYDCGEPLSKYIADIRLSLVQK